MKQSGIRIWFKCVLLGLTMVVALFAESAAAQQNFPSRQITLIYPYSPGGNGDALLRLICNEVTSKLGQNIVIEHRPGANGRLGLLAQLNARGDAHLLSFAGGNVMTIDAQRDPNFRIQPVKDYTPITTLYAGPYLVVVSPSVPYRDIKSFVAYARANPGKVNMALSSVGSISQIAMQSLADQQGFEFTGVPYKGDVPVWQALMVGEAHIGILATGALPNILAGRLVAIATTAKQRLPQLTDVPTVAEAGYPVLSNFTFWTGLIAPADIGADATNKLNTTFSAAMRLPEFSKRFADIGSSPGGIPADEFLNQIKSQMAVMAPVIAKIKFE